MLRFTARRAGTNASRSHLRHTFGSMPVGGRFFLRTGKTLYVKTSARKYRDADDTKSTFEYTARRSDMLVRYPSKEEDTVGRARARKPSCLHRDEDGKSRCRGKGGRWAAKARRKVIADGQLEPIDREILADVKRKPAERKLPRPGDSVVYDRHYNNLAALGLIEWHRVSPGHSSFADHYVLSKRARAAPSSIQKLTKAITALNRKRKQRERDAKQKRSDRATARGSKKIGTLHRAPKSKKWPPTHWSGVASFADVPVGEDFFLGQGKTLYTKTSPRLYAKVPATPSSFEFTIDRPETAVRFPGKKNAASRTAQKRLLRGGVGPYFTIHIPYADVGATKWHPTERTGPWSVIQRGAFKKREQAHKWAKEHLNGTKYTLRRH